MAFPLFDAHCHLQDPRIGEAVEGMVQRGREAGLRGLVCCGTGPGDWDRVLGLAARYREVIPMLGLHPWRVASAPVDWARRLREAALAHRVGIGECGLDFAIQGDRTLQEEALRVQLRLAREVDRPIALHCVRAWGRMLAILCEEGLPRAGGLIHAYSGSAAMAVIFQDLGLHLSFSGGIARPGNRKAAAVLPVVRADRLLLESDAPDQGIGDGLNEPARITSVIRAIGSLRPESESSLAELAYANGTRLFEGWMA